MIRFLCGGTSLLLVVLSATASAAEDRRGPFVAHRADPDFRPPQIILQHDPAKGTGYAWEALDASPDLIRLKDALLFLQEGIERMTGARLAITSGTDLSEGLVFTTLEAADEAVRRDPAIIAALASTGADPYHATEAFHIRSEPDRLLVVANTPEGFICAIPELLESVGYEVLGMGPNWIHVPRDHREALVFDIEQSGNPGYYIRDLWAASGQERSVGTIGGGAADHLTHPDDEAVDKSYARWRIGTRMHSRSMPRFPGHALQSYHGKVIGHIRESGDPAGFLGNVLSGPDAERPETPPGGGNQLWINTDSEGDASGKAYYVRGGQWVEASPQNAGLAMDLSVPAVREIILENLKERSLAHFEREPDSRFVFATDPEDGGGYLRFAEQVAYPDWYPEYRRESGRPLGEPYVLHGLNGLDQPRELWDPAAPSDTVFAFNNWLLAEFDAWVDSLPPEQRVTSSGKSLKDMVCVSLYSYNMHDVPPNFNLDPRIRVMIAGFPKHRGRGKWREFATQTDIAQAFQLLLPREPAGDYWIISIAYYRDDSLNGLPATWDMSPESLAGRISENHDAGFRAVSAEIDFNFGKYGLGYYLISRLLWDPSLDAEALNAVRERWLQRAYGNGWKPMREYYDFLLPENYPVNAPAAWAKAIRLIDAADALIDPANEPDAQRRLDDLKQFWYYYYLVDSGKAGSSEPEFREFIWKGQMSYMTAMHMVVRRNFNTRNLAEALSPEEMRAPAHYGPEETREWWRRILDHWPVVPVSHFAEGELADGRPAAEADLNDLVLVEEFGEVAPHQGYWFNANQQQAPSLVTVANEPGEEIGFKLFWVADPSGAQLAHAPRDVSYGLSVWNAENGDWEMLIDEAMTSQPSTEVKNLPGRDRPMHVVRVSHPAPRAGTYRFDIGRAGNGCMLTDLGFDLAGNFHTARKPFAFTSASQALTQSPVYFYIPKGTSSLDLEVWDSFDKKTLTLHGETQPQSSAAGRAVDISARGTHRIELLPGEDGAIASIAGNGFAFPYFYSVPLLWAKHPSQLPVPRAIAEADGLTIIVPKEGG